jgi:hypothetical protein
MSGIFSGAHAPKPMAKTVISGPSIVPFFYNTKRPSANFDKHTGKNSLISREQAFLHSDPNQSNRQDQEARLLIP